VQFGELLGAVLDEEAVEHDLDDALFFRRQGGDGFEQQGPPTALREALVDVQDEFAERDIQHRSTDPFGAVRLGHYTHRTQRSSRFPTRSSA